MYPDLSLSHNLYKNQNNPKRHSYPLVQMVYQPIYQPSALGFSFPYPIFYPQEEFMTSSCPSQFSYEINRAQSIFTPGKSEEPSNSLRVKLTEDNSLKEFKGQIKIPEVFQCVRSFIDKNCIKEEVLGLAKVTTPIKPNTMYSCAHAIAKNVTSDADGLTEVDPKSLDNAFKKIDWIGDYLVTFKRFVPSFIKYDEVTGKSKIMKPVLFLHLKHKISGVISRVDIGCIQNILDIGNPYSDYYTNLDENTYVTDGIFVWNCAAICRGDSDNGYAVTMDYFKNGVLHPIVKKEDQHDLNTQLCHLFYDDPINILIYLSKMAAIQLLSEKSIEERENFFAQNLCQAISLMKQFNGGTNEIYVALSRLPKKVLVNRMVRDFGFGEAQSHFLMLKKTGVLKTVLLILSHPEKTNFDKISPEINEKIDKSLEKKYDFFLYLLGKWDKEFDFDIKNCKDEHAICALLISFVFEKIEPLKEINERFDLFFGSFIEVRRKNEIDIVKDKIMSSLKKIIKKYRIILEKEENQKLKDEKENQKLKDEKEEINQIKVEEKKKKKPKNKKVEVKVLPPAENIVTQTKPKEKLESVGQAEKIFDANTTLIELKEYIQKLMEVEKEPKKIKNKLNNKLKHLNIQLTENILLDQFSYEAGQIYFKMKIYFEANKTLFVKYFFPLQNEDQTILNIVKEICLNKKIENFFDPCLVVEEGETKFQYKYGEFILEQGKITKAQEDWRKCFKGGSYHQLLDILSLIEVSKNKYEIEFNDTSLFVGGVVRNEKGDFIFSGYLNNCAFNGIYHKLNGIYDYEGEITLEVDDFDKFKLMNFFMQSIKKMKEDLIMSVYTNDVFKQSVIKNIDFFNSGSKSKIKFKKEMEDVLKKKYVFKGVFSFKNKSLFFKEGNLIKELSSNDFLSYMVFDNLAIPVTTYLNKKADCSFCTYWHFKTINLSNTYKKNVKINSKYYNVCGSSKSNLIQDGFALTIEGDIYKITPHNVYIEWPFNLPSAEELCRLQSFILDPRQFVGNALLEIAKLNCHSAAEINFKDEIYVLFRLSNGMTYVYLKALYIKENGLENYLTLFQPPVPVKLQWPLNFEAGEFNDEFGILSIHKISTKENQYYIKFYDQDYFEGQVISAEQKKDGINQLNLYGNLNGCFFDGGRMKYIDVDQYCYIGGLFLNEINFVKWKVFNLFFKSLVRFFDCDRSIALENKMVELNKNFVNDFLKSEKEQSEFIKPMVFQGCFIFFNDEISFENGCLKKLITTYQQEISYFIHDRFLKSFAHCVVLNLKNFTVSVPWGCVGIPFSRGYELKHMVEANYEEMTYAGLTIGGVPQEGCLLTKDNKLYAIEREHVYFLGKNSFKMFIDVGGFNLIEDLSFFLADMKNNSNKEIVVRGKSYIVSKKPDGNIYVKLYQSCLLAQLKINA